MNPLAYKIEESGKKTAFNGKNMLNEIKNMMRNNYADSYTKWCKDKFSLNYLFNGKYTLLDMAAEYDFVVWAEFLIQNGADVDAVDYIKNTPLHHAAHFGSIQTMKFLIENGANVNAEGLFETPLHTVIKDVHAGLRIPMINLLIENGADVEALNFIEDRPLHAACKEDDGLDVVRILIENGAAIDGLDKEENTPLHIAVHYNTFDIVQVLVENGASINLFNKAGETPLLLAVTENRLEIVKCLVAVGADINANSDGHRIHLDLARELGNYEMVQYFTENLVNAARIRLFQCRKLKC